MKHYRFIQDMTVDNYEIVETEEENEYSKYLKIKFNISENDNNYFPIGESYWDLIVASVMELVTLFSSSNEKNITYLSNVHGLKEDKEYNFCYLFRFFLEYLKRRLISEDVYWGGLLHGITHYYETTASNRANLLTADIAEDYTIKTTGITYIDYTASGHYN